MKPIRLALGILACLGMAIATHRSQPEIPRLLQDALNNPRLEDVDIGAALRLDDAAKMAPVSGKAMDSHPFHCVSRWETDHFFVVVGNLAPPHNFGHARAWQQAGSADLKTKPHELRGSLQSQGQGGDVDSDFIGTLHNADSLKYFKKLEIYLAPSWRSKGPGEAYIGKLTAHLYEDPEYLGRGANALCYNGTPEDRYPGIPVRDAEARVIAEAEKFDKIKFWLKTVPPINNLPLDRVFQETDILTPRELAQPRQFPLYRGTNSAPNIKFLEGFKPRFYENFKPDEEHARSLADVLSISSFDDRSGRTHWIYCSKSKAVASKYGRFVYEIYKPGGIDIDEIARRYIPKMVSSASRVSWHEEVIFSRPIEPRYIRGAYDKESGKFIPNPNFAP